MTLCGAFFILCLGFFQGDRKLMVVGAGLIAVALAMPGIDVLGGLGFDTDAIDGAMSGDRD